MANTFSAGNASHTGRGARMRSVLGSVGLLATLVLVSGIVMGCALIALLLAVLAPS